MSEFTTRRPYTITGPRGADPAVRDHSEQELRRKLSATVMSKMGRKRLMPPRKIMTGIACAAEHHHSMISQLSHSSHSRGRK